MEDEEEEGGGHDCRIGVLGSSNPPPTAVVESASRYWLT